MEDETTGPSAKQKNAGETEKDEGSGDSEDDDFNPIHSDLDQRVLEGTKKEPLKSDLMSDGASPCYPSSPAAEQAFHSMGANSGNAASTPSNATTNNNNHKYDEEEDKDKTDDVRCTM